MPKAQASLSTLAHEGEDAFAKVTHHLKTMTSHLADDAGDAMSVTAVALGHAAVELVGEVQAKLDQAVRQAEREVRRHPAESIVSAAAAAALVAAAVASLTTYALARRRA